MTQDQRDRLQAAVSRYDELMRALTAAERHLTALTTDPGLTVGDIEITVKANPASAGTLYYELLGPLPGDAAARRRVLDGVIARLRERVDSLRTELESLQP